ncbi:MAG TPA: hypothetical protein VNL77_04850 [Roseiflexaceae bacterium]|nr:hypothetical protein [Roseiflexaceae bacterium]
MLAPTDRTPRASGMLLAALLALLTLAACSGVPAAQPAPTPGGQAHTDDHSAGISMDHIHGMGYAGDGAALYVAAHDGLRVYADGAWRRPDGPRHDYMGFAPVADGFYSSGHPAPGSGLPNPLGLIKSGDAGRTIATLAFQGESDFHLMAAGYRSGAIYVVNPAPNSRLGAGLFYTLDAGATWKQSAARGLSAAPVQLAVHPTDPAVVALASEQGLLLSTDHGDSFAPVGPAGPVSAAAFTPDGARLLYGLTSLSAYDLASRQVVTLDAPALGAEDAIAYLAVNPVRPDEVTLATYGLDIYLSRGGAWEQIARQGEPAAP